MEYEITGGVVQIDESDLPLIGQYKWHIRKMASGICYAASALYLGKKNGRSVTATLYMHRLLLGLDRGDRRLADHRDGDGLNNKRDNLRVASHAQNMANRKTRNQGVQQRGTRWIARIQSKGKATYLGRFDTEQEAKDAYVFASTQLRGDFART